MSAHDSVGAAATAALCLASEFFERLASLHDAPLPCQMQLCVPVELICERGWWKASESFLKRKLAGRHTIRDITSLARSCRHSAQRGRSHGQIDRDFIPSLTAHSLVLSELAGRMRHCNWHQDSHCKSDGTSITQAGHVLHEHAKPRPSLVESIVPSHLDVDGERSHVLRGQAQQAWQMRWSVMLVCSGAKAFAESQRASSSKALCDHRHAGLAA